MPNKVDSPWDNTVDEVIQMVNCMADVEQLRITIRHLLEQAYSSGYLKAMYQYRNQPPEPGN